MKVGIQAISDISDAMRKYPDENWVDALSSGQLKSKEWLLDRLQIPHTPQTICIVGSWLGILPLLMYENNEEFNMERHQCYGVDQNMSSISASYIVNQQNNFQGICGDAIYFNYEHIESLKPDIVINTSCEHFSESDFKKWLIRIPLGAKVYLQSNNFFDCEDHVNPKRSLTEFEFDCTLLTSIEFSGKLDIEHVPYTRYMIIGTR